MRRWCVVDEGAEWARAGDVVRLLLKVRKERVVKFVREIRMYMTTRIGSGW